MIFIGADSVVQDVFNPQSHNRYIYTMNNPLNYMDPDGHARYRVSWTTARVGDIFGGAYISGTVTALEKNEMGRYNAVDFAGVFKGITLGSPAGETTSISDFEDKHIKPDVKRIMGDGIYVSGSIAFEDGKSIGKYKFNELVSTNDDANCLTEERGNINSRIEGHEFGVDLFWGGIWLQGDEYEVEAVQPINEFFNENILDKKNYQNNTNNISKNVPFINSNDNKK
jgi:hypothetical protein